jgi:hypothetical protein
VELTTDMCAAMLWRRALGDEAAEEIFGVVADKEEEEEDEGEDKDMASTGRDSMTIRGAIFWGADERPWLVAGCVSSKWQVPARRGELWLCLKRPVANETCGINVQLLIAQMVSAEGNPKRGW